MYQKTVKSDFAAEWIAAPLALLRTLDRPRTEEFPRASFIWGRDYNRQHLCRTFEIKGEVADASLHFICDNLCDVFLNGVCISADQREHRAAHIAHLFKVGENILWLRTYQTASPDRFSSAIIGGLGITYADGRCEEIVTDSNFRCKRLVDFWGTCEPEGWERTTSDCRELPLITSELHPIAVKRSCYFRKSFYSGPNVSRATLFASAQGCYEPYLNGSPVTDARFLPSASDKAKEYQRFDVTALLRAGENTLGAITGNGWYNCAAYGRLFANLPAVMMELMIEYKDGTCERVTTDATWQVAPSPLTDNDLQFGERYDARAELDGWCEPRGDGYAWMNAETVSPRPHTALIEQNYPPVRVVKRHVCRYVGEIEKGVWLYDIGVNIAGCVGIRLHTPVRGARILLQCCERLREDGTPETGAYGAVCFQQDTTAEGRSPWCRRNLNVYVAKGEACEVYSPHFSYTGFRYVYVSGMRECPAEEDLFAEEMHNDLNDAGSFSSSDPSLMRLWEAVRQTWKNNCFNGPTDCPTREKNFWNGDAQIFSHAACWCTDAADFLGRWTDIGRKMQPGPYGWEDEEYEIPWTLYRFYGDTEILRVKYPAMLALIEKRQEGEGMLLPAHPHSPYNDWLNPTGQNLSAAFFGGCWYLHMLDTVSRVAEVLGDAKTKEDLAARYRLGCAEFNRLHYDFNRAEYDEKLQSALVLPLAFGILPSEERMRAGETLDRYVREAGYTLTTGFLATRYLLDVLTETGHFDTAIRLLHQTEFPSWNDMLNTGATNVTESWHGLRDPDPSISMSHFSLGAAVSFFFEYLGGIRVNESGAGLSHVVFKPHFHPAIGDVSVRYQTARGEIVSEWHYENGKPVWRYELPEGMRAEVLL